MLQPKSSSANAGTASSDLQSAIDKDLKPKSRPLADTRITIHYRNLSRILAQPTTQLVTRRLGPKARARKPFSSPRTTITTAAAAMSLARSRRQRLRHSRVVELAHAFAAIRQA